MSNAPLRKCKDKSNNKSLSKSSSSFLFLLLRSQLYLSNYIIRIPSSWMVHAACFCCRHAFTRLGHQCQDLVSPCDRMHVCIDWTLFLYPHPKGFVGNGVRTPPPYPPSPPPPPPPPLQEAHRRVESATLHHAGQRAQHTTD